MTWGTFSVPPEVAVVNCYKAPRVDPRSLGRIFSFPSAAFSNSHTSNFIDLRRYHQLFIHTPGFGTYDTLGPSGERNVLAKAPVDVGHGGRSTST